MDYREFLKGRWSQQPERESQNERIEGAPIRIDSSGPIMAAEGAGNIDVTNAIGIRGIAINPERHQPKNDCQHPKSLDEPSANSGLFSLDFCCNHQRRSFDRVV